MIIQCESCSRKFIVKDSDIPKKGRVVQCGYCSVTWHQMPILKTGKALKQTKIKKITSDSSLTEEIKELKKLYDEGVLTKKEFEKAKKKLLN